MSEVQGIGGYCSTCNKPIRDQRIGSLTGWIFGGIVCGCALRSILSTSMKFASEAIPQQETIPTISSRYKADQFIDKGGMSTVWKVWDEHLEKYSVIKLLRPEMISSPTLLQRFTEEARTCARFNHPNLVPVTDFGMSDNHLPFLAMDLIDGSSLRVIIDSKKLTLSECISLTIQICKGMQFAHDYSVTHRDLKPENILIALDEADNPVAKIIDFGIARLDQTGGEMQRLTTTGEIFGSASYMSPEQCFGINVDRRSDIYSLGCILYELLSGHPPFRGTNLMDVLNKQVKDQPLPLKQRADGTPIPPDLNTIMLKCLNKSPDDRYDTMTDLQAALKNVAVTKNVPRLSSGRIVASIVLLVLGFAAGFICFGFKPLFPDGRKHMAADQSSSYRFIEHFFDCTVASNDGIKEYEKSILALLEEADRQKAPAFVKCAIMKDFFVFLESNGSQSESADRLFLRMKPELKKVESSDPKNPAYKKRLFIVAYVYQCAGRHAIRMKNWFAAEERLKKTLELADIHGIAKPEGIAYVLMDLGHVYVHTGRSKEAIATLEKAQNILVQHPIQNGSMLSELNGFMAEAWMSQRDFEKALEYRRVQKEFLLRGGKDVRVVDQTIKNLTDLQSKAAEAKKMGRRFDDHIALPD